MNNEASARRAHSSHPVVHRGLGRFDAVVTVVVEVGDAVGDPVHVRLGVQHHVGQHGRRARARHDEEVRESVDAEAEVGAGPTGPVVAQPLAAATDDVDLGQRARHRVEPGGEHDRVDVVVGVGGVDAGGVDGLDGCLTHADQLDVGSIERLKVVGVGADSLGADRVVGGDEQVGELWDRR